MDNRDITPISLLSYTLLIMTVTHVLTHAFQGIHTSIFSLLREEFDISLTQLGIIAAIPPLCQALLAIPTGLLSDRIGAKKMLIASFLVATIGAILASQTINLFTFIIAISLVYVNTTIYHPASYSYTTNLFRPSDRSKALGIHGAGGTLGHGLGPLTVSLVIGVLGLAWRNVYLLLTGPMFAALAMVLTLKETKTTFDDESRPSVNMDSSPDRFLTSNLVMFLVFSGLRMMAGSMISTFLVLYLQDVRQLSIAVASFVSSSRTLLGFVAAPLGGYLAARYGEKRWLFNLLVVSYVLLSIALVQPEVTGFIAFYIASGFCGTLVMAARSSIMAQLTPRRRRGLGYALYFLPGSIMGAVAPIVAGYVAASFGFNAVFMISLMISAIALIILKLAVHIK
ncbi:MAG: MFS transporter [Candidatus Bathyarchaeota archaeon]|nr:MFS transporter [Candidatus Bathyarchaeota archaeon]